MMQSNHLDFLQKCIYICLYVCYNGTTEKEGVNMANRQMKSFRLSEDAISDISIIARELDLSNTEVVELALWFFRKSGASMAIWTYKQLGGELSSSRFLDEVLADGEILTHMMVTPVSFVDD